MPKVNDADLRLRDFKVLSVLLRERSLTRAAEVLETTQPSVSKILARLRSHFDDPLFVRHGQAMQPTTKALEMSEPLRGLLLAADILCPSCWHMASESGRLTTWCATSSRPRNGELSAGGSG
jgi:DNA-binding transcriptional LysR family regulator